MDLLRRQTGGGSVGLCIVIVLVGWGVLTLGARPALALDPTGQVIWPPETKVVPCAVDGSVTCQAAAGPYPGYFTWHIGGNDYGPDYGGYYSFQVTGAARYSVSATYTYTGQGGGSVELPGGSIQAIESRPRIEGGTTAYLAVNGARKEIELGYYYGKTEGERNKLTLSNDAGLVVYAAETAETPLTARVWDDYELNNWEDWPGSVWVAATETGQKYVGLEFYMANPIQLPDNWAGADHTASVLLNCVEADLWVPDVPYTQEEDPGVYLGGGRNLYLSVNGPQLGGEGTVTLT